MKPLRARRRRPPPPSVRVASAEIQTSPRRSCLDDHQKAAVNSPRPYSAYNMSFAGRRRGNKVKKGVQFTVMVVGQYFPSYSCASSASAHCYLGALDVERVFILSV